MNNAWIPLWNLWSSFFSCLCSPRRPELTTIGRRRNGYAMDCEVGGRERNWVWSTVGVSTIDPLSQWSSMRVSTIDPLSHRQRYDEAAHARRSQETNIIPRCRSQSVSLRHATQTESFLLLSTDLLTDLLANESLTKQTFFQRAGKGSCVKEDTDEEKFGFVSNWI